MFQTKKALFAPLLWLSAAAITIFVLVAASKQILPEFFSAPVEEGVGIFSESPRAASGSGLAAAAIIGEAALDFRLFDIEGKKYSLQDWKVQPLVILFWASWNEESIMLLENLESISKRLPQANYASISSQEPEVFVRNYLRGVSVGLPVLVDSEGRVTEAYRVQFLPTTVLIDADGKIADIISRPLEVSELENRIAKLLEAD